MEPKNRIKYVGVARFDNGQHVMLAKYCWDDREPEFERYLNKILKQDSKLTEGKLLRIPASQEDYDFLVKLPRPDTEYDMRLAIVGVVNRLMTKQKCAALCKQVVADFKGKFKPRQIILAEEMGLSRSSQKFLKEAIVAHGGDKLQDVNQQLNVVKSQMKDNLLGVIQRGEDLENLEDGTQDLMEGAARFNSTAGALKRAMCCKNLKMTIILYTTIFLIVGVIIVIAVCGTGEACKSDSPSSSPSPGPSPTPAPTNFPTPAPV
mmetsp:Transcript_16022/g.28761  ORF Transcript_16022/g.28761 Transcript_16022/m.28761 type:complete len:263 (+) Transcript_16022:27-815(+)